VIHQINQSGMAICFVEQNAVLALGMAKRAYVFDGGRIVREGEAKDLRRDKAIQAAYLGTE
jgi:branched-chain amino acid transport system ATP-binding protein